MTRFSDGIDHAVFIKASKLLPQAMLEFAASHPLKNFSLDVAFSMGPELMALFGPSGSGKSLTLQMIAGLVQPQCGLIRLDGQTVFSSRDRINWPPQQRRVGYVMQDYLLFPHLSVAQNIAYGLRRRGWTKQKKRRAVTDMLDLIRLPNFAEHRPHELSGGQQQRVALARALITQPDILLLDEPFSALDTPTRVQLRQELRQLLREVNRPALLVTHDLAEANILADRIAVYFEGKLLQVGSPREIMVKPAAVRVAQLTGNSNCFAGRIETAAAQEMWVRIGALRLRTPYYPFPAGQPVHCCIRPEQIILLRSEQKQDRYQNVVQVRLMGVMTDGLSYSLQLCLTSGRLRRDTAHDFVVTLPLHVFESLRPAVGEIRYVSLKPTAIHLIEANPASGYRPTHLS